MAVHHKSIIKEALDRLDALMAIGESRRAAKLEARAAGEHTWTFSTGKMHSFTTRTVYQQHVLAFVNWARAEHGVTHLADLDAQANELATSYLTRHVDAGKSPYTLQAQRAALRLFFADRELASEVQLPRRLHSNITRSRQSVDHDRHFQPANWQVHIAFEQATGLRRAELRELRVHDVYQAQDGKVYVHVESGKGGREREVPVLPGREQDVLAVVTGRQPDERVFASIPKHWDVHSCRREFAQALYLHYVECNVPLHQAKLPPAAGRLRRSDYDADAAQRVSWALGHNRIDVVLRHYLR